MYTRTPRAPIFWCFMVQNEMRLWPDTKIENVNNIKEDNVVAWKGLDGTHDLVFSVAFSPFTSSNLNARLLVSLRWTSVNSSTVPYFLCFLYEFVFCFVIPHLLFCCWQCHPWMHCIHRHLLSRSIVHQYNSTSYNVRYITLFLKIFFVVLECWPPLWSSGQSYWLQIQRSRVRFPALPDFLSSSGSGTGST